MLVGLAPTFWDRYVIPKRRRETNLRCVTYQKAVKLKYKRVIFPPLVSTVQILLTNVATDIFKSYFSYKIYFNTDFIRPRIFPCFGLLRGVGWFKTDVSRLPIESIFKSQTVQEELSSYLDSLILEDGTDR